MNTADIVYATLLAGVGVAFLPFWMYLFDIWLSMVLEAWSAIKWTWSRG